MSCFLGIDLGTSGIKTIVMDAAGTVLGEASGQYPLINPRPNWVEQNPLDWWEACGEAVAKAVSRSGRGKDIVGIGLSGQMQGLTLLDEKQRPVGNCLIWLDQRAAQIADELNGLLPADEILSINANFCLPSYWAAKLVWLQRNAEAEYARAKMALFPKDYLRFRMTGEIAAEVSDASCSWLIDMKSRTWSDKLFEIAGISKDIVPGNLLESCDVAGTLLPEVAERWGVPAGIPVAAGAGDQQAGGIGNGIVQSGVVSSMIGTSGVIFGCCDTPFIDHKPRAMYSQCHAIPGKYNYLGCTLGAGGSYQWIRDTLFKSQTELVGEKEKDLYSIMEDLAAAAPAGCEGLCFLPYMSGESTPHNDPDARGVFFGLSYRHDMGSLVRSVMEGVTYSLRDTIEIIKEVSGLHITEVRALGGGAKSAAWRQIQADIFNTSIVTMNLNEGSAAGAAILGAVAAGVFKSVEEACSTILKATSRIDPIPANAAVYQEYYQTYRSLYPALKNTFHEQAARVKQFM